jgi:hypothetical protein|tara:strand:- start:2291 stop:2614 length:324 start_codon:yes stop_codon:yes gene_type:complete
MDGNKMAELTRAQTLIEHQLHHIMAMKVKPQHVTIKIDMVFFHDAKRYKCIDITESAAICIPCEKKRITIKDKHGKVKSFWGIDGKSELRISPTSSVIRYLPNRGKA